MDRLKKWFIALIAIIVIGVPVVSEAAAYSDVSSNTRFSQEITYLSERGIISGYPNGSFQPDASVTREAVAMMLVRALELPVSASSSFPDVGRASTASQSIEAAVKEGIISGYPDGTFRPKEHVTRAQLAIFLARSFDYEREEHERRFRDISSQMVAYPYIMQLVEANVVSGFPDDTFRPDALVTRGQFSAFLTRTLKKEGMSSPSKPSVPTEPAPVVPSEPKPEVPKPSVKKEASVHFIDVGQGDATLLQTPEGANILVDAGVAKEGATVVRTLREHGVESLDLVIATHPHADHIGGMRAVLEAFPVKRYVDSGRVHTSQTYVKLLEAIDAKNVPFEVATIGDTYRFNSGVSLRVVHTDANAALINDASVSVRAVYGDVSLLLTGDAEKEGEARMLQHGPLQSTVYKAGHHGSNTSSSDALLQAVRPAYVIFSYGANNSYGHPHREVVERIRTLGASTFETAKDGTITMTTDGKTVEFQTSRTLQRAS